MKNIFKNNKGFTLIELLAVVAVLGVLLSITLYVTMDVVDSARRKSYEVTLNNVEKHAGTYVYENSGKIFFLNSGAIEYQCVKVQDLIDMGYLNENVVNSPISSSSNVTKNSYVYIERNASTKTITKSIYDFAMNDSCSIATSAKGDITFSVSPDLNKWAKEKEVQIVYRLKDSSVSHSYTYMVSGAGSSFTTATQNPQSVTVTESGTVISATFSSEKELAGLLYSTGTEVL